MICTRSRGSSKRRESTQQREMLETLEMCKRKAACNTRFTEHPDPDNIVYPTSLNSKRNFLKDFEARASTTWDWLLGTLKNRQCYYPLPSGLPTYSVKCLVRALRKSALVSSLRTAPLSDARTSTLFIASLISPTTVIDPAVTAAQLGFQLQRYSIATRISNA